MGQNVYTCTLIPVKMQSICDTIECLNGGLIRYIHFSAYIYIQEIVIV